MCTQAAQLALCFPCREQTAFGYTTGYIVRVGQDKTESNMLSYVFYQETFKHVDNLLIYIVVYMYVHNYPVVCEEVAVIVQIHIKMAIIQRCIMDMNYL